LTADRQELFLGATFNTAVKGLTFGAAYDSIWNNDIATGASPEITMGLEGGYASSAASYASYAWNDKTSINGRAEYAHGGVVGPGAQEILAFTATFQYQFWLNVLSRVEVRWDHSARGDELGGPVAVPPANPSARNQTMVAANVIYKF
jgi:hypothetical protein